MQKILEIYFKIYAYIENNKFLNSIKRSLILLVPVFMIGAISLAIQYFPIEGFRTFISTEFNGVIYSFLDGVYKSTFGLVSLYLVIAVSFYYSKNFTKKESLRFYSSINSIICYFIFLGPNFFSESKVDIFSYTNMTNVFAALISSLISVHLFFLFIELFLKVKKTRIEVKNELQVAMYSLCSMAVDALIFGFIANLIALINNINNFNDLVTYVISSPFEKLGPTFLGGLILLFLQSILWLFGIHGSNVFEKVNTTIFAFDGVNIISKNFMDCYVLLGGCGSSFCLLLAIIFFSKNKERKKISYSAMGPMLFNINEIMVFGLPIVLNPIYAIPFVLTPLVNYIVAYIFSLSGALPLITNSEVMWTTPIILSGYLATESFMGSLVQLINLLVGTALYLPFVKIDDYFTYKYSSLAIDEMCKYIRTCELEHRKTDILSLDSRLSLVGESIVSKVDKDINSDKITLFYQPQYQDGKIVSFEGLLRFKYLEDSYLYPPIVVNLSLENNIFKDLSKEVVKRALSDLNDFVKYNKDFTMTINLRLELLIDEDFMNFLFEEVKKSNLQDYAFGIELTEETYLPSSLDLSSVFKKIHENKISIYLDDFSMGSTSLTYLQNNHFDYVKLDGSLVSNIENERSKNIIGSIISLGKDLDFKVIAEYVETEVQEKILKELGCDIVQGYLYSKAVAKEEIIKLLSK